MGNTVTLQNFRKFQDLANNVKIIRSLLKFLLNTLIVMSFPLFPKIIFFLFFRILFLDTATGGSSAALIVADPKVNGAYTSLS